VPSGDEGALLGFLADLEERIRQAEQQLVKVKEGLHALRCRQLDEGDVRGVLEQFGPVWDGLTPTEQARLVRLVVAAVEYDGKAQTVSISFHPAGIRTLADELAAQQECERKEKRA
jgi:site-specific DNA recombinase